MTFVSAWVKAESGSLLLEAAPALCPPEGSHTAGGLAAVAGCLYQAAVAITAQITLMINICLLMAFIEHLEIELKDRIKLN